MSKPLPSNGLVPAIAQELQVKFYADQYRDTVNPASYARMTARAKEFNLAFTPDELVIFAALDTPSKVQEFFNKQLYYNYDHSTPDSEETAMSPRQVLQTARAHCFEGALFAYAVNFFHGHLPRWVYLEAIRDSDHNLVLYQDPATGLYGCNAQSGYEHLDGRPAEYASVRALVDSFYPYYYSDYTLDPNDITLVGYSEPFDIIPKYGLDWVLSDAPLWHIYYTYIDDSVKLYNYPDTTNETHLYPFVNMLKYRWFQVSAHGTPEMHLERLPLEAQELWHAFWRAYGDPNKRILLNEQAREIENKFRRLTGTTPVDFRDSLDYFAAFLASGTPISAIVHSA